MTETVDQIARLSKHYILCGAGRAGRHIIDRFIESDLPFVVVDQSMAVIEKLQENIDRRAMPFPYIIDDATEDEALEQAGIAKAKGLIAALGDDKDNLFVILTARSLNPDLRIIARVNDDKSNMEKLEKAGADKVISTNAIGGLRMASEMIRPVVVDFLDQMVQTSEKKKKLRFTELPLPQIKTPELRNLIQATQETGEARYDLRINDIGKHTGLLVVAIKTRDEEDDRFYRRSDDPFPLRKRYRFTPRGDEKLDINDILVVIGTQDKLDEAVGN